MQLRRFYEIPTLYQDWNDRQSHRKVGWGEAFYDLLYVVGSMNVAHRYHHHVEVEEVGVFFLYFSMMFTTWMRTTTFHTRFKTDSLLFDFFDLLYFLGTLGMVMSCQHNSDHSIFAANFAVVTAIHGILCLIVAASMPRVRRMCLWHTGTNAISVALAVIAIFLDFDAFVALGTTSLVLDWVSMLTIRPILGKCAAVPLHVDHMSERFGLITMIFLGESVVSIGLAALTSTVAYVGETLGATLIWTIHLAYYNCHPDQDLHAMRISVLRGFVWTAGHWLMGAAMLSTGAGLRLTLDLFGNDAAVEASHHRHLLRQLLGGPDIESDKGREQHNSEHHGQDADGNVSGAGGVGVPAAAAWVLCASYAITLTLVAVTRASHYWSLPGKANAWRELNEKYNTAILNRLWWAFVFLWPQLAYCVAGTRALLTPTSLIGTLAIHGVLFIFLECCITNYLSTRTGFSEGLAEIMEVSIRSNGNVHGRASLTSTTSHVEKMELGASSSLNKPASTKIQVEANPSQEVHQQ